jgi:hypothetical protein
MTLHQPTFGHGGNARCDEEVTTMTPAPPASADPSSTPSDVDPRNQFEPPSRVYFPIGGDLTEENVRRVAKAMAQWMDEVQKSYQPPQPEVCDE